MCLPGAGLGIQRRLRTRRLRWFSHLPSQTSVRSPGTPYPENAPASREALQYQGSPTEGPAVRRRVGLLTALP